MEPPAKRQRLGLGPAESEDEDELDFDPEELNQRRDPGYQLEQARDHAAYKLKSRFENIFAKYEKDFTGVGDEIDLRTGQVVVDNGHLKSMRSVTNMGDDEEDDEDPEEEEERIMHGKRATGSTTSDAVMRRDTWAVADSNMIRSPLSPMMGGPPRLSSMMFPSHNSIMTPPRSFDSFGSGASLSIEPTWQAPDLPRSAFMHSRFGTPGRQYSFGIGASTRKATMKALPAPRDQEEEDDDVLLGVSGNVLKKESATKSPLIKSPLIKEKFPTVDSSPNNDPGLKDLIQDVIENIPETPPSVQRPIASKLATMRQLSERSQSSQPKLEPKGKPRGRPRKTGAGETRKKEPIGAKLDVSQENGRAPSADSPTRIKSQSNQKSLAGRAGAIAQPSGPGRDASFQKRDLDLYQDVTGMAAMNFNRHAFYVEIEARNVNGVDVQVRPKATTTNRKSMGSESQNAQPSGVQKTFERNVIDPTFTFSDEETLQARKPRKDRRKSEPANLAAPQVLQASRLNLQQPHPAEDLFQRNAVDSSYAFSDEENLLPKRANTTRRKPEPAVSSTLDAKEDSLAGRRPDNVPVSQPTEMHDSPPERKRRRQSMRSTRKPMVAVDTPVDGPEELVSSDALPAESELARMSPSVGTDTSKSRTRRPRGDKPMTAPVSVHSQQPADQESGTADTDSSAAPRTVRRRVGRPRKVERVASPELGDPAFLGADTATGEVDKDASETWSAPRATPAPAQQPSTPQCKSRATNKNTPSSKPGLISLLSDNEDEEDEISFDLSAFTPSGHHRILTHRPHDPHITTSTPHAASNSMTSKKKRASSLLFGPSSTSKISKHRTPGSERRDGKGKRRGSTNSLARSVVKVRRESFRAPSPAGSVVRTPGGTKRRCGQDGFRCERDFCFVCISI